MDFLSSHQDVQTEPFYNSLLVRNTYRRLVMGILQILVVLLRSGFLDGQASPAPPKVLTSLELPRYLARYLGRKVCREKRRLYGYYEKTTQLGGWALCQMIVIFFNTGFVLDCIFNQALSDCVWGNVAIATRPIFVVRPLKQPDLASELSQTLDSTSYLSLRSDV